MHLYIYIYIYIHACIYIRDCIPIVVWSKSPQKATSIWSKQQCCQTHQHRFMGAWPGAFIKRTMHAYTCIYIGIYAHSSTAHCVSRSISWTCDPVFDSGNEIVLLNMHMHAYCTCAHFSCMHAVFAQQLRYRHTWGQQPLECRCECTVAPHWNKTRELSSSCPHPLLGVPQHGVHPNTCWTPSVSSSSHNCVLALWRHQTSFWQRR